VALVVKRRVDELGLDAQQFPGRPETSMSRLEEEE
jgi:hypothetical protein